MGWKNTKNKWISYDYKTCKKVEMLPINGMYEYTTNSFIAKISGNTGLHVNIATEEKREIKRIKKRIENVIVEAEEERQKLKAKVEENKRFKQEIVIKAKEAISKHKLKY